MGVDVADGNSDSLAKSRPGCRLGREFSGFCAELTNFVVEFFDRKVCKARVQRCEELFRRILAILQIALVAGGASVANILAAKLPDNPVGGFDELKHAFVNFLIFFEELQPLGELPLRRNLTAVSRHPRFISVAPELIDAIRVWLGCVMLPELHVCVRSIFEFVEIRKRSRIFEHRQNRAGCEVCCDADDIIGINRRQSNCFRNRVLQDFDVVVGILKCPIWCQRSAGGVEFFIHDGIRIIKDGTSHLFAI